MKKEKKETSKKRKNKEKKSALWNTEMLNKARKEIINFYDDYSSMVSEAKTRGTKGTGLKRLIPKEMLQKLTIALAQ